MFAPSASTSCKLICRINPRRSVEESCADHHGNLSCPFLLQIEAVEGFCGNLPIDCKEKRICLDPKLSFQRGGNRGPGGLQLGLPGHAADEARKRKKKYISFI